MWEMQECGPYKKSGKILKQNKFRKQIGRRQLP